MAQKWIRLATIIMTCLLLNIVLAENNPLVGICTHVAWINADFIASTQNNYGSRHIDIWGTWVYWDADFNARQAVIDGVYGNGSVLELSWQPMRAGGSAITNAEINNGSFDSYIRQYAQQIAAWGKVIHLRPMHEMNGDWFGWSPGKNGNTNESYIAAWRRMVNIFREEGATNARWVYSVNWGGKNPFMAMYPGDDYVDYMSMDGYNWGTTQSWSRWQSFDDAFLNAYTAIKAPGKPVTISEWGCVTPGGDKSAWIKASFETMQFSGRYDLIHATVWFDLQQNEKDFQISTSPAHIQAFVDATDYALTWPIYEGEAVPAGRPRILPGNFTQSNTRDFQPGTMAFFDVQGRAVSSRMPPAGMNKAASVYLRRLDGCAVSQAMVSR